MLLYFTTTSHSVVSSIPPLPHPPPYFLSKAVFQYNSDINKKINVCELREWWRQVLQNG